MNHDLYIYGASNPQNLALARRRFTTGWVRGWIDDDPDRQGKEYLGLHVYALCDVPRGVRIVNCVCSDLVARRSVYNRIREHGCRPISLIDSTTIIFEGAVVLEGAYIQSFVSVQAGAAVGVNCTLHTGCMVGERVTLGSHTFVGPGAMLCGRGTHGEGVYFGANCTVLPDVNIGMRAIIGAGAVVTKNVRAYATVVGVPAKSI